jgi:hypothetical protein
MKNYVMKKTYFYKRLSKDSYNRNKLMVKNMSNNNLLDTLEKYSQFQKCGILKLWKFKVCTLENLEFQNFKSVLPHINEV